MTCYTPFTIEDTFCGRQAEYILKSIEGWDSTCGPLNPTGSVCCRLLRRLGDVLMGIRDSSRSKLNQYFNSRKRGDMHIDYTDNEELNGDADTKSNNDSNRGSVTSSGRKEQIEVSNRAAPGKNYGECENIIAMLKLYLFFVFLLGEWNLAENINVFQSYEGKRNIITIYHE
jgi:hypothetical protein